MKKHSIERRNKIAETISGKKSPSNAIVQETIEYHKKNDVSIINSIDFIHEKYQDTFSKNRLRKLVSEYIEIPRFKHPWQAITKEILYDLYHVQKLSKSEICRLYKTSNQKLNELLIEFDISKRSQSENMSIYMQKYSQEVGENHYLKSEEFKQIATKSKIERYGTPYPNLTMTSSRSELEIKKFIEQVSGKNFKKHYIGRSEFDIYNEELKLAIEFCGLYWHCEDNHANPKDSKYHVNKLKLAEEHRIRLITIFEDEWLFRNSQVKSFLSSLFPLKSIRASKCSLISLNKNQANDFYEKYHIQGKTSNNILLSYGLIYEGSLIGAMSFSKHHRQNGNGIVLSRMCFHDSFRIHGGASKLFRCSIKYIQENYPEYNEIISWSDNRWSQGNVYGKLGFDLEQVLSPDYSYVKGTKRFPKQSMTKKKLNTSTEQTEKQRALELGYSRIWDCGKKLWSFNIFQVFLGHQIT
jgi:hypothetical protein